MRRIPQQEQVNPHAPTRAQMTAAHQTSDIVIIRNELAGDIATSQTIVLGRKQSDRVRDAYVAPNTLYVDKVVDYYRKRVNWGVARGWEAQGIRQAKAWGRETAEARGMDARMANTLAGMIEGDMLSHEMEISVGAEGLFTGVALFVEGNILEAGVRNTATRAVVSFDVLGERAVPRGYQFIGVLNADQQAAFRGWFMQQRFQEYRQWRADFKAWADFKGIMGPIIEELIKWCYYRGPQQRIRVWKGMPRQFVGSDPTIVDLLLVEGGLQAIHAYIVSQGSSWSIANGTAGCTMYITTEQGQWRNIPGPGAELIKDGAELYLGNTTFRVEELR